MRSWLLYGTIALVTFAVFLVAFAPASLAWRLVHAEVDAAIPDLEVLRVDGSVWRGDADVRYREFPPATLDWTIDPFAIAGMSLEVDATLTGEGLLFRGSGGGDRTRATVNATGYIDSSYINPVSTRYGLTFPGRIDITRLELESDLAWFTAASGQAAWDGGRVVVESLQGAEAITLPALEGELTLRDRNLQLDVTGGGELFLQVTLKPTGWAVVDMKARLLDVSGLPYNAGTNPNASAFIVEEKLF